MMSLRRFANLGSGSGNERYNDTCANLAGNTNITCAGYGSMTAATGASFITVYGDNDLNGCTSCQSIAVQGHGIGNNIISGGSDVFLNGDSTGDVSFSEAIGTGASVSGNDAIALGRSSSAIANSIGIGSGVANAAGAVVIDPTFGAATNAKANTMQYQGANFVDAAGYLYGTNKQYVTTDFTDSTSTTLTAITGLSWTLPTSRAAVFSFHCGLLFDQATAAVSDSFGVGVTGTAPTNLSASGTVFTAAGVETTGTLVGLASTTPTAVVTFTPSAITTVWKAELDGTIEQPSNATPGVFNIYVSTTTGGDNIIVKRGSYCSLF